MFFGMAISFLMVPFSLLFKDVQNAIGVFFGLLIFITPVGLKAYPETFLENLMALNPISDLIVFGRMLALSQPMPNFVDLIPLTLFSVLLFLIGLVIFFVVIPIAIERRSA
jgi:lipopolysaccharide transport system permease protein